MLMDEKHIEELANSAAVAVQVYAGGLDVYTDSIRPGVRIIADDLKAQVDLQVSECEAYLVRSVGLLAQSADYHIIRAIFHASPALLELLLAIIAVIQEVIHIINIINDVITAVTGHNIMHYIGMAWPEFEEWWNDLMKKISGFSAKLGWGVDGIGHLMNAFHIGADSWAAAWGKDYGTLKFAKLERTQEMLYSMRTGLKKWEQDPGGQIANFAANVNVTGWSETRAKFLIFSANIDNALNRAETALQGISGVAQELAALQDNMPDFIARHIPQSIWDGLERTQDVIDNAILPAITDIHDRVEELNSVLQTYQERAEALAESLNRPGDILERIQQLEEQAQLEQYEKVDAASNFMFEKANTDEYNEKAAEFANLGAIIEVLQGAPAPLPYMQLELPGASPGIVSEPHETWLVGDY